jgi:hypothetical protein
MTLFTSHETTSSHSALFRFQMTASFINDQLPNLAQDRVENLSYADLVVCRLCQGILWLPVACKTCEIPYCLSCIKNWQLECSESGKCPNNCSQYIQRACPPAIAHILAKLQVICRYEPNGCTETLLYDKLNGHEDACGYRQLTCSGCKKEIAKKDYNEHDNQCKFVLLTCSECSTVYQRQDADKHSETKCLRVQLNELRDQLIQNEEAQSVKINQLKSQVNTLVETIAQLNL